MFPCSNPPYSNEMLLQSFVTTDSFESGALEPAGIEAPPHPSVWRSPPAPVLLGRGGQDGVVVVVLLLLVDDLQLQEELLLLQDLGVGRVLLGRRLPLGLLVRGDVLVVLELLHLGLGVFGLLRALGVPV